MAWPRGAARRSAHAAVANMNIIAPPGGGHFQRTTWGCLRHESERALPAEDDTGQQGGSKAVLSPAWQAALKDASNLVGTQ